MSSNGKESGANSCPLCKNADNDEMVMCDQCDRWHHFSCVGVDETVQQRDWLCGGCEELDAETTITTNIEGTATGTATGTTTLEKDTDANPSRIQENNQVRLNTNTLKRSIEIEMMKLEEEKEAQLLYINKKFSLLKKEYTNLLQDSEVGAHDGSVKGKGIGGREINNLNKLDNQQNIRQGAESFISTSTLAPSYEKFYARQVVSRELPTFSGRPEEWPLFYSCFETSTRLCGITNEENLLRLQRSLKGKALDYVSHSLTLPALVPEIISTLQMVFGRPEHILNTLVTRVRASPSVNPNKLESLINFSLEVKNIVATIEASGLRSHMNNPLLLQELIDKLPVQKRLEWAIYADTVTEITLKTLSDWLYKIAQVASKVLSIPVLGTNTTDYEKRKVHRVSFHEDSITPNFSSSLSEKCVACNELHCITMCYKFKEMNYNEKWNLINKEKICRSCLRRHDLRFCRERKECLTEGCRAKHHPLLHKPNTKPTEAAIVAMHNTETSKVLYRIVPITIFGKNCSIDVYAFLDDGSGPTLIEKEILEAIGAKGATSDLCLKWTDGTIRVEKDSHSINLQVAPKDKINKRFTLQNVRSVKKLDLPSQTIRMEELTDTFKHLKGLPVKSYRNVVPRVVIGINNRSLAMPIKFREGKANEPAATKTRLGWTIYGELGQCPNTKSTAQSVNLHICDCNEAVLESLVIENMKIENEGIKRTQMQENNSAMDLLLQNSVKRDGERFIVKLLWKNENIKLPDNDSMAYRRLCCFERKLEKDPKLREQVNNHIESMETKGYIRKLQKKEIIADYKRKWNLPIFAVKNPNKPKKTRIVWDAAAECNGVSLNSCLIKGPDLMTSLTDVLFNFRVGKVGICGDISEMFHRIAIDEEDQQCQRFLWRNGNTNCKPDMYVLKVMSFGASCSPSIAQYVKNLNAREFNQSFPRAVKSIVERHYVDDMLDSVNSIEEAITLAKDVRKIHKHANFHIRNWVSNSKQVIQALGEAGTAENFCRSGKTVEQIVEAEKVLGIWWQTSIDSFTFNLKYTKANEDVLRGDKLPTKRELLRLLMSIFDPLGFLNFFTVYMKILLQDIWRSGIEWDETIPQEFSEAWNRWLSRLQDVQKILLPRCYFGLACNESSKVQLHIFVDASEKAYAAVAYFRIESSGGIEVTLVCSKTKVAPLRPVSIPRLELQAAVLGSRLGNVIEKAHDFKIDATHYWSDSRTVLLWLEGDPRAYKQFVMFRVSEIQESTNVKNWKYIPTKQNVADLATKWNAQPEFHTNSPWFIGPKFLIQPPEKWPSTKIPEGEFPNVQPEEDPEIQQHQSIQFHEPIVDFKRFSKWERITSCMAYVKRFISLVSQKRITGISTKHNKINLNFNSIANLSQDELLWGHHFLYRLAQAQSFSLENRLLLQNPHCSLPKSSPLRRLSPFIDENKIIRMRGRLERSLIVNTCKNPILMPKSHYITELIVDWYHRRLKHINHETVINEIFQTFHIIGLRALFRSLRSRCQMCKIRRASPNPPEMAPLPEARLSPYTRPFSYVGVDFFGPFLVTIGRRTEKRYGAVFTCLTCRAIHIEVAHSLTMNSCVMVIRNFIARRGNPLQFFSDNGTNLKAAEKELREAYSQIDFKSIGAKFTTLCMKWEFIPPASPHMGGAWERMVRSIKTVLYQIITPDTKMTDEKLINLLIEVESIVNSRPLTYLSLDTAEQEALTPNHFILGSSSGNKPPGVFDTTDAYVKSSWRHSQLLADRFWKRWVAEILPTLNQRTDWFNKVKPIEEGNIVIIVDPALPRYCWPKGVVVKAIKGKDGQVRSCIVRTTCGEYHRPAAKIAVLDVQGNGGVDKVI